MNATTGDLWLIRAGGQDYGPYTIDQVRGFIDEGRVQAQTEIAAAGGAAWTTVAALPVFASVLGVSAPPAMPPRAGAARPSAGTRAGFWIRAGAILVDGVILMVGNLVIGGVVGTILGDVVASLVSFAVGVAYFVVLHSQPQQATFGKRLLGLRLVRDDGAPVTPKFALARYAAAFLSSVILGIGFLLALFRDDRKTLHDILCNTHVVKVEG
jgi:uncharacterized RDD family membrane protein YckC